jgi:hypothetical protein
MTFPDDGIDPDDEHGLDATRRSGSRGVRGRVGCGNANRMGH